MIPHYIYETLLRIYTILVYTVYGFTDEGASR